MLNKLCFLILSLTIAILTGCGNAPTSSTSPTSHVTQQDNPKDIRDDLYKDSIDVLNVYSDFIENGKVPTDEQNRKIDFYFSKYKNTDNLNQSEVLLMMEMVKIRAEVGLFDNGYKSRDNKEKDGNVKSYLQDKEKVKSMLNLK